MISIVVNLEDPSDITVAAEGLRDAASQWRRAAEGGARDIRAEQLRGEHDGAANARVVAALGRAATMEATAAALEAATELQQPLAAAPAPASGGGGEAPPLAGVHLASAPGRPVPPAAAQAPAQPAGAGQVRVPTDAELIALGYAPAGGRLPGQNPGASPVLGAQYPVQQVTQPVPPAPPADPRAAQTLAHLQQAAAMRGGLRVVAGPPAAQPLVYGQPQQAEPEVSDAELLAAMGDQGFHDEWGNPL